ncbi:MAG: T9SS type A sorting domain-containing protein [Bacteroidota bacterium]
MSGQDAGINEAGITLDGINYSELSSSGSSINNVTIIKNEGQRLGLTSAYIKTFKKKGITNICSGYIFYRIYSQGTTPPPFSQITCSLFSNLNNSTHDLQNQEWFNNTINIDLINGLSAGEYSMDIYYGANVFAGASGCNDGPTTYIQNIQAKIAITPALNTQFTGFDTNSNNEYVYLRWQISDSSDVQYFTVEKSKNGVQWQTLDTIPRNGNSYVYIDSIPVIGVNYYRIQAAGSGKTVYSISRRAYVGVIDNLITVYPNPVNKNLRFEMSALTKGRYQAVVYSLNGVRVAGQVIDHDGKDNYVTIPLPSIISRGMYWLVLMTKNEFYKQNFLVQ